MNRTKWMRLLVRDPADILRWAGAQQARHLGDFRYRMIGGRETVSFRLTPNYAIQIGTREIMVVAHVRPPLRARILATAGRAVKSVYAGAASAARWSRPFRPTPINSTISAAPMHISPDTMKASR